MHDSPVPARTVPSCGDRRRPAGIALLKAKHRDEFTGSAGAPGVADFPSSSRYCLRVCLVNRALPVKLAAMSAMPEGCLTSDGPA